MAPVRWITLLCCAMACIVLPACHKNSGGSNAKRLLPQEAKRRRLEWNIKTTVEAYQTAGHRSSSWDESAENALNEFARTRAQATATNENWQEIIATNCAAAVNAGCDDPLVLYLYTKHAMSHTNSAVAYAAAFCNVAQAMEKSSYPEIRKFYADVRALEQLSYAYGAAVAQRPEFRQPQIDVGRHMLNILIDKSAPPEEVYDVCDEELQGFRGRAEDYKQAYSEIEGGLDRNWPNEPTTWLLKGRAQIQMAWNARGNGYADSVTAEGWKEFALHLSAAKDALAKAWKLDPADVRIPTEMLSFELGSGKDRKEMELWFQRAMDLDPNNYQACSTKLQYLQPKWYGSTEDAINFGRECVRNKKWGGFVPMVLVDAHYAASRTAGSREEKENYWKQPEVWPDLQMAFDRYLGDFPNDSDRRNLYAAYAYQCEQWGPFLAMVPTLEPDNYNFLGTKDQFDAMIRQAKERLNQASAAH